MHYIFFLSNQKDLVFFPQILLHMKIGFINIVYSYKYSLYSLTIPNNSVHVNNISKRNTMGQIPSTQGQAV